MATPVHSYPPTHTRCIALFPGAFRPPHAAHLTAVQNLLADPAVDEVVIIISNRCRSIPGTTLALDASVAQKIWSIYLQGLDNVRVEIAPHTAIRHALGYFDSLSPGDTLMFCIGERDLEAGDTRFNKLNRFIKRTAVNAKRISAPTGAINIRAISLRQALVQGDPGRSEFMSALPRHLSPAQSEQVWELCRTGLQDMDLILQKKVHQLIRKHKLGEIKSIGKAGNSKVDQVFRVTLSDGQHYFVKYAGDTVDAGTLGQPLLHKPRRRLGTERRTLNRLRKLSLDTVALPEVILFDKNTWSLVLSEVCPGGDSLQHALESGHFDPQPAKAIARFLAGCHGAPATLEPVWGEEETDRQHWQAILRMRTLELCSYKFPASLCRALQKLYADSEQATMRRLFLLDMSPVNIFIHCKVTGITDFELSSTYGDAACDLGLLIGHYLLWGRVTHSGHACQSVLQTLLREYRKHADSSWPKISARVVAFAGAGILFSLKARQSKLQDHETAIITMASRLLSAGSPAGAEEEIVLSTLTSWM